jgi:hypothetical protein
MTTYMLIVTDDANMQRTRSIITDDLRIDFIGIGEATIGRHYRGQRPNVIVNRSNYYDLSNTKHEYIDDWYHRSLLACADKNVKIYDGVDK